MLLKGMAVSLKRVVCILLVLILSITLWGCTKTEKKETAAEETVNKNELTVEQRLAVDFLFKLAKNYTESPYNIKVYDVKIYTDDKLWYYISANVDLDGLRQRYGNSVMFRIDEDIHFTSKKSSAYKFFTEENKASDRGEELDLSSINDELSKLLSAQREVDKSAELKGQSL